LWTIQALRRRTGEAAHALVGKLWTTDRTGYLLAHWLVNRELTIESIRSACESDSKPVDTYLSAWRNQDAVASSLMLPRGKAEMLSERTEGLLAAHRAGRRCAAFIYEIDKRRYAYVSLFRSITFTRRLLTPTAGMRSSFFVSEIALLDEVFDAAEEVVLVRMRTRPDVRALVARLHAAGKPVAYLIDEECGWCRVCSSYRGELWGVTE